MDTARITNHQINYPTVVVDSFDSVYVAYTDQTLGNKLSFKKRMANGYWRTLGMEGFTTYKVYGVSMAVSASGFPYVAFVDGAAGNKASVM